MGTSNSNDIVIESNEVASRHQKFTRLVKPGKFKIFTFMKQLRKWRRIDQRFLPDGDEVTLGDVLKQVQHKQNQIQADAQTKN
ncbi:MAG: hypothetical protein CM1200mP28_02990 [Deltaproteobacteria bacterium]|nr:MAG: hypothetical protein CM1200mP28_02990 [Deltaproteobacteria bacterium]